MKGHKVIIEIDENGKTRLQFQGFKGRLCFDEAEKIYNLLKKLGVNVKVLERKQEAGLSSDVTIGTEVKNK